MLSWATIEQAIAAWAQSASGLAASNVRWGLQDAPTPERPFVTLVWGALDMQLGNPVRDEKRTTSTAGTQSIVHFRTHSLSVQYFAAVPTAASGASGHASAALGQMIRSLQTEATRAQLLVAGLRIATIGTPADVSALLETSYDTRAAVDLEFATADQTTEQVGTISTVDGPTGTVT